MEQILHASIGVFRDYPELVQFIRNDYKITDGLNQLRPPLIQWISNIVELSKVSIDTRDTSIQIVDKFLAIEIVKSVYSRHGGSPYTSDIFRVANDSSSAAGDYYEDDENDDQLFNHELLSIMAASAIIVASKIHDRRPIRPSNFGDYYSSADIVAFEQRLLQTISFEVIPQAAPTAFIKRLIELWPTTTDPNDHHHRSASSASALPLGEAEQFELWVDDASSTGSQMSSSATSISRKRPPPRGSCPPPFTFDEVDAASMERAKRRNCGDENASPSPLASPRVACASPSSSSESEADITAARGSTPQHFRASSSSSASVSSSSSSFIPRGRGESTASLGGRGGSSSIRAVKRKHFNADQETIIQDMADDLVGKFFEDIRSLQFAPSTIAIAALLLTFSKLEISCSDWVQALPDVCLPPRKGTRHAFLGGGLESYLDVDKCLQVFQSLNIFSATSASSSPSSSSSSSSSSSPRSRKIVVVPQQVKQQQLQQAGNSLKQTVYEDTINSISAVV